MRPSPGNSEKPTKKSASTRTTGGRLWPCGNAAGVNAAGIDRINYGPTIERAT